MNEWTRIYTARSHKQISHALIYIGWSDVTDSMVKIWSPFRGYNMTMSGIKGQRFIVLFGHKLNHWLANKARNQDRSNKNFSAFYLQNGGEKRRP